MKIMGVDEQRIVIRSGIDNQACMFNNYNTMTVCTSKWAEIFGFYNKYRISCPDGDMEAFIEGLDAEKLVRNTEMAVIPITVTVSDFMMKNCDRYGVCISRLEGDNNAT
jgi:hypothetical protein